MELATAKDQAEQHLQRLAEHAISSRRARALQHEAERLEHKYGRKLERLAKQLPVDTPLDRRRRHRSRRRGVEVGVVVVAVAGAAAAYLLFRHKDPNASWYAEDREPATDTEPGTGTGTGTGTEPSEQPSGAAPTSTASTKAARTTDDDAPRHNGSSKKADAAS